MVFGNPTAYLSETISSFRLPETKEYGLLQKGKARDSSPVTSQAYRAMEREVERLT